MPGEVRLEPIVALTDAPPADENHAIGSGLARFNAQQSGLRGRRPLAVVVRDPQTKQPTGGLTGRTSLFYERHGYQVLGIVPCLPPGTSRIFMMKPLA